MTRPQQTIRKMLWEFSGEDPFVLTLQLMCVGMGIVLLILCWTNFGIKFPIAAILLAVFIRWLVKGIREEPPS